MTAASEPIAAERGAAVAPPPGQEALAPASPEAGLRAVAFWACMLALSAGSGVVFDLISGRGPLMAGAVYGLCVGGLVVAFERGTLGAGARQWLRRLPLVPSVIGLEVAYIVAACCGTALGGTVLVLSGLTREGWRVATIPTPVELFYALLVSGILVSVNRMRELIGTDVFANLLLGRYYHPVEEERIFLFLDLIGSTAYAHAHGALRTQEYLSAIFAAVAEPVRRHGGSIADYVGDMVMVTWTMEAGLREARCVRCVTAINAAVQAEAARWQRDFGQVPRFRAALHGGPVVIAEVGVDRHKITYFGDVVNTTARLEKLCRDVEGEMLLSSDLFDRLPALPTATLATPRGRHDLRGRGQPLAVFSLDRRAV